MNCSWSTEGVTPKGPSCSDSGQQASAVFLHRSFAHTSTPSSDCVRPRREREQGLSVFRASVTTPAPFHSRSSSSLGPSPPSLIAHPRGRQPHQLFPAAGAPIGCRPAAPNINDTQEPGLEAQAREQTPSRTAPAPSHEQLCILR